MSKRQMLINHVPGEECRIAITEDGRLEELYQERASAESHVGNIYKGRVINVEPSIQAAFVDFGLERNGFLHISDLHPMYFPGSAKEETEQVGLKTPRRDRPPIQKCLRRGQSILVQVLKEGIGTKGPTLTSYLSIPGRYLVMMPNMEKMGVSRKVEDDDARRESRKVLDELNPPEGFGFIIRTAGIGRTKTDLKRDLAYLQRLWKNIDRRMQEVDVGELFAESDLVIRTIRDVYTSDVERIIVDEAGAARRARDYLAIASPRSGSNVLLYKDAIPLFHRYDLERQIENINARVVPLPSGGSLVIDSTEALVAIDVNSGKFRDHRDAEMTAYKTNLEAVDEICRQLRLRDLGGVIVNDLIDMRSPQHRREVETRFRENLKNDRARTRTSPISQFGILEMTRQRMRPSLRKSIYTECAACGGSGSSKSPESVVLDVMRRLQLVMQREAIARLELTVSPDVAFQLLNRKRGSLVSLEHAYGKPVLVRVNASGPVDYLGLAGFDARGAAVQVEFTERFGEPSLEPVEDGEITGVDDVDESVAIEEEVAQEVAAQEQAEQEAADRAAAEAAATEADAPVADGEGEPGSEGDEVPRRFDVDGDAPPDAAHDHEIAAHVESVEPPAQTDEAGTPHTHAHPHHGQRPRVQQPRVQQPQHGGEQREGDEEGGGGRRRRRRRRGGRRHRKRRSQDGQPQGDGHGQPRDGSAQHANDGEHADDERESEGSHESEGDDQTPIVPKGYSRNGSIVQEAVGEDPAPGNERPEEEAPPEIDGNVKPPETDDETDGETDGNLTASQDSGGNEGGSQEGQQQGGGRRRRRRRGRRGRGRNRGDGQQQGGEQHGGGQQQPHQQQRPPQQGQHGQQGQPRHQQGGQGQRPQQQADGQHRQQGGQSNRNNQQGGRPPREDRPERGEQSRGQTQPPARDHGDDGYDAPPPPPPPPPPSSSMLAVPLNAPKEAPANQPSPPPASATPPKPAPRGFRSLRKSSDTGTP